MSDRQKIHQVLSNLLANAIKFTHRGKIILTAGKENQKMVFTVQDTGIGIPENMHEKIFERFCQLDAGATREFGGTGLGLTIARNLADLLNGAIGLESVLHSGSVFSLYLPLVEYKAKEEHVSSRLLVKSSEKEPVILVAEDEDVNYLFLEEVLATFNTQIIRAKNGLEAIDKCKEHADSVAVILMDVKMPLMNGFDATRKIKELFPEIPVIAQTAYAMSEDREKAMEAGCDAYLTKPVDENKLLPLVEKYLEKKQSV